VRTAVAGNHCQTRNGTMMMTIDALVRVLFVLPQPLAACGRRKKSESTHVAAAQYRLDTHHTFCLYRGRRRRRRRGGGGACERGYRVWWCEWGFLEYIIIGSVCVQCNNNQQ
jgi:hypothetical protein